jgi:hypothetical protein
MATPPAPAVPSSSGGRVVPSVLFRGPFNPADSFALDRAFVAFDSQSSFGVKSPDGDLDTVVSVVVNSRL